MQTPVWFFGHREASWSSMRQACLRLIICIPSEQHIGKDLAPSKGGRQPVASSIKVLEGTHGTVLTNITGPHHLAEELSTVILTRVLECTRMGQDCLQDIWTLSFVIIRVINEQLDPALDMLDPIGAFKKVGQHSLQL